MKFLEKYKAKILTGKKAKYYIHSYYMSDYSGLEQAYKNYSVEKHTAYKHCIEQEYKDAGNYLTGMIIAHNSMTFTYAYKVLESDGTQWLIVITYANKYAIKLGWWGEQC